MKKTNISLAMIIIEYITKQKSTKFS